MAAAPYAGGGGGGGGGGGAGGGAGDPPMADDTLVYHERQQSALCGVHALNGLLQGPLLSEVDLAGIAAELDDRERQLMAEAGADNPALIAFLAQGSHNVDDSGNFSVEVLREALRRANNLELTSDPKAVAAALANPNAYDAYLFNLQQHWFAIRRLPTRAGPRWFNLDSMVDRPELIGDFFLSAFLSQMKAEGYSIFAVTGRLPPTMAPLGAGYGGGGAGAWHKVADIARLSGKSAAEKQSLHKQAVAQAQALAAADSEYAEALRASLADARSRGGDYADDDFGMGGVRGAAGRRVGAMELATMTDDERLQMALAASMASAPGGAGAPSAASPYAASTFVAPPPASAAGSRTNKNAAAGPHVVDIGDVDDDDELNRAIALSLQQASPAHTAARDGGGVYAAMPSIVRGSTPGSALPATAAGQAVPAAPNSAEVAAAIARLRALVPAEPQQSEAYTRIQVRLPAASALGPVAAAATSAPQPVQRRFRPENTVADLLHWAELAWLEASASAAVLSPLAAARDSSLPIHAPPFQLVVAAPPYSAFASSDATGPTAAGAITLADAALIPSVSLMLRPRNA